MNVNLGVSERVSTYGYGVSRLAEAAPSQLSQPFSSGGKTMLDRDQVEQMLENLRTSRVSGDIDRLMGCFAEDATFRIVGIGQPTSGRNAIRQVIRDLVQTFEFLEWHPVKTLVTGDEIWLHSALKVRHRPSGRVADSETSDSITLRDGKILAYVQFTDTALVNDLLQG